MAKSRQDSPPQRKKSEIQVRIQKAFNGRSLSDIARLLGENPSSFWNWTAGRTEIPSSVLAKIARFNISVSWILAATGDPLTTPKPTSIEEALDRKIREIVREELANERGGEVGQIQPAEMMWAPNHGTVDGGEENEEVPKRRKKTG